MNEQPLGRYLRERLTALPDGQPILLLTLAEELARKFFFTSEQKKVSYCHTRINLYFRGQFCRYSWGRRGETILVKRGTHYGLALVYWPRLALGEELGERKGC